MSVNACLSLCCRPIQDVPYLSPGWAPADPCEPYVDKAGTENGWMSKRPKFLVHREEKDDKKRQNKEPTKVIR